MRCFLRAFFGVWRCAVNGFCLFLFCVMQWKGTERESGTFGNRCMECVELESIAAGATEIDRLLDLAGCSCLVRFTTAIHHPNFLCRSSLLC